MEETSSGLNGVVVVRKYFQEDYSWSNFINCIDDGYDLKDIANRVESSKEVVGKVNFWKKLTMTLDNINNKNFPGIEDKVEKLTMFHSRISRQTKCRGYFGAVSLTSKEETTGKHSDPIDVIYCEFIGSVTWKVFDEDKHEDFILNPGDIIYVPKSVVHEVTSLTPRAAISFMFEAE
jgi:quercetin dioxygenase-like cupin family protein